MDFEELGETENVEADTEVEKPKPKEEEEAPANGTFIIIFAIIFSCVIL